MLPAKNRLTKTKEIERVWKGGRSFFAPILTVKAVKNGTEETRVTAVVGTKAEKSAVKRNAWRRRVKDILRKNLAGLRPGFDIIVQAKKGGVEADYADLARVLMDTLRKAGLIKSV